MENREIEVVLVVWGVRSGIPYIASRYDGGGVVIQVIDVMCGTLVGGRRCRDRVKVCAQECALNMIVAELCSAGQPMAAVPTWSVCVQQSVEKMSAATVVRMKSAAGLRLRSAGASLRSG